MQQQRHPEPELDELYRELILDHYKRPRNRDIPANAQVRAEGYNPVCGDEVEMGLVFDNADGGGWRRSGWCRAGARSRRRRGR